MKSSIFTGLALIALTGFVAPSAQAAPRLDNEAITAKYPFTVKLNLSSLAVFQTFSVQGEWVFADKMSLALGVRAMPSSKLPFRSMLKSFADDPAGNENASVTRIINDTRVSDFAITPEFRYYLGKSAGRGLYLAPFLRYESHGIKTTFVDDEGTVDPIALSGAWNAVGVGLMFGSQFNLTERFTLDWWILGPYYTSNTLKVSASNLDLPTDQVEAVRDAMKEAELAWFKVSSDVSEQRIALKAKGSLGAIRGFGLCFGFRF